MMGQCAWCDRVKRIRYTGVLRDAKEGVLLEAIPICTIACAQQWNRWERNKGFMHHTKFPGISKKKLTKLRLDQIDRR